MQQDKTLKFIKIYVELEVVNKFSVTFFIFQISTTSGSLPVHLHVYLVVTVQRTPDSLPTTFHIFLAYNT